MNILTFDIEDWWVYEHYQLGNPKDYLPRLDRYLNEILDLLEERNFQATFFCLGEVAHKNPEVIKKIHHRGHHIGCHSFSHRFFGEATPNEVEKDTKKALAVLEDIIGEKVNAYRAPAFSITENNKWIFEILIDNGIEYDCSIFPANRSFGGFSGFNHSIPTVVKINDKSIKELPMSITKLLHTHIASAGGGYFKLMPYSLIKSIVQKSDYIMTYFHLKDFDKDQVKRYASLQNESALIRYFKNYYGLKGNFTKFKKFVSDFEFVSVEQANEHVNWHKQPYIKLV